MDPTGIDSLTEVEKYIESYFLALVNKQPTPLPCLALDTALLMECEHAASILARAFQNPVLWPYNAEWYESHTPGQDRGPESEREQALKERFGPLYPYPYPVLSVPTTVIDDEGRILVWYLPDILFSARQAEIWEHTSILDGVLKKSVSKENSKARIKPPWRTMERHFVGGEMRGCVNLAPAWFQRGRNEYRTSLEVSELLKSEGAARQWIIKMIPAFQLLNGIARVIHPEQHTIGRQAINKLMRDPSWVKEGLSAQEMISNWTTVYAALAVILNRDSPDHRDMSSPAHGLDMMLTVGNYDSAYLTLSGLGLELLWTSGSMTALSGPLIRHEVEKSPNNRLCIAFYMRNSVHEKLGLRPIPWMTQKRHNSGVF